MKIFILMMGTRGDFEIMRAMGHELVMRGHQVRMGASPFYEDSARSAGLDWLGLGEGSLLDLQRCLEAIDREPNPRTRVERYFTEWVRPQLKQSSGAVNQAMSEADYGINNMKSVWTRGRAVMPGACVTYELPRNLEDLKKHVPRRLPHEGRILQVVALPRRLVDPERRWDPAHVFTGFCQTPVRGPLSPDLDAFMASGPPPVVFTMGSMVSSEMQRWVSAWEEALASTGRRGVLVGGWSSLDRIGARSDRVYAVPEAPYDSLFARAACVIHHGGCGTVAAALRNGVVSIVLPRIPSQSHFADLLAMRSLSAATLDGTRADARAMKEAIEGATGESRFVDAAMQWQQALAGEAGPSSAAAAIEAHAHGLAEGAP